jgi:arsenate reductase
LTSKSWQVFAGPASPRMDFVFTVCDNAAGETCPLWPGQPITAHWGIKDPAAVGGSDIQNEAAFATAFNQLKQRISVFLSLPLANLDDMSLQAKLRDIGQMEGATAPRPKVA